MVYLATSCAVVAVFLFTILLLPLTGLFFAMCGCFAVFDDCYLVLVVFTDRLAGNGFFRFDCLRLLRLVDAVVVVNA